MQHLTNVKVGNMKLLHNITEHFCTMLCNTDESTLQYPYNMHYFTNIIQHFDNVINLRLSLCKALC